MGVQDEGFVRIIPANSRHFVLVAARYLGRPLGVEFLRREALDDRLVDAGHRDVADGVRVGGSVHVGRWQEGTAFVGIYVKDDGFKHSNRSSSCSSSTSMLDVVVLGNH